MDRDNADTSHNWMMAQDGSDHDNVVVPLTGLD
jgi:hypothetical protein